MPPALALLGLVALKCAVSAWALHVGFTHISDDDYARVTIAQAFAHAPRLDPSGTSWLPFPFWLDGAAMALFGRSLAVARVVAILSSVGGAVAVHRALVVSGVKAWAAWCGVALAMCTPWNVWLGVATVPEALSASLVAAGALTLAMDAEPRATVLGGGALLVACLSRYEAWPVALVFSAVCLMRLVPELRRGRARATPWLYAYAAGLAMLGPSLWVLWNAHAHGDAFHFFARVAAYRLRVRGGGGAPASWAFYPEALVRASPWTLALMAVGAPGLLVDRALRRRWAWPLAAMLALALVLIEGELHDGAPTHHPERTLVAVFWLAATFGVDGLRSLSVRFVWGHAKREAWLVGGVVASIVGAGLTWPGRIADYPARSEEEDRAPQIARGRELVRRGVKSVTVAPCAYEHFALIAAFEAPEQVTVLPVKSPAAVVTTTCPELLEP